MVPSLTYAPHRPTSNIQVNMMNRSFSDDIVQDSLPPSPLEPMDSTHERTKARKQQYANYSIPPNDAPFSRQNPNGTSAADHSSKLVAPQKQSFRGVPVLSDLTLKEAPSSSGKSSTGQLKKPPLPQKKMPPPAGSSFQRDIQWSGSLFPSLEQAKKTAKQAPPVAYKVTLPVAPARKSTTTATVNPKPLNDYPSFHDDASEVEQYKKLGYDSSHSSVTFYAWDSPSYHRTRPELLQSNSRQRQMVEDDATTASFPSFYSLSVHSKPSCSSANPSSTTTTTASSSTRTSTTRSSSSSNSTAVEIAIAPGVTARLRGASETTQAVQNCFITRSTCWGCQQDVFCIADCQWAICPMCKTISPMEHTDAEVKAHGLGLGLTRDTLHNLQTECFGPATKTTASGGGRR